MTEPNRAYYEFCVGRWRGALRFAITDRAALRSAPIGILDRLTAWAMVWSAPIVGPPAIETSVAFVGPDEVLHTTRIVKWGVPLFRSVERLTLRPDGREVAMGGAQWPVPWRAIPYEGASVTVDEDARGATYRFRGLGADLVQQTRWIGDGLQVEQRAAWFRGEFLLKRRD